MSVGIVKAGKTVSAIALGKGNPVFFVGSATGKDGIGGASFASAEITADSVEELPAVQVGDPFQEKKLLEACLEVIETGGVVGMQDMGAAGIICSTAEMSAKGQVGMRIDLDKVPTRQQNMKAWELLLSESQERMLMVVEKGREADVLAVFEKWDLSCSNIGEVTDDGLLNFYMHGELEASLPAYELVLGGGAPQYTREYKEPAYLAKVNAFDMNTIADTDNLKASVEALIQLPNIASKRWVYTQYDSMVGAANTSTNAPSDAAVVLAKGTGKALAMTVDCNSKYVFADPFKGAMIAVSEAARNIVCSGGEPIGVTNCLNFGNPYDPEVYYQFVKSVEGMGAACRKFNTPVTGGNVSFYNQNPDGPVFPTPTIGMVGIVEDMKNRMTLDFKEEGDTIVLLGTQRNDIGSSEYLNKLKGVAHSSAPHFELEEEFALQQLVAQLIKDHTIESAHDISEGGLIVTLLESAYFNNKGFEVSSNNSDLRKDAYWMGEAQSRVVVSCKAASVAAIEAAAAKAGIATFVMGKVTGGAVKVEGEDWGSISAWKNKYDTAIENKLK
jgi:phosphoribosylformylglycinamidine synthase